MVADSVPAKTVDGSRRRNIPRRVLLLLIVVAVLALAVLALGLFPVAVWSGRFDLTLDVSSISGEHIKDVSYATFFKLEQAEWMETHTTGEAESALHPAAQDKGRFIAAVGCSGRTWIFGIETKYTEFRYIVVRVKYGSGKEVRRLAEIPAGRGPRSMAVVVP